MRGPAEERVVALLGFMGAGKTTVGKSLARRLERPFVDLDDRIRGRTGRCAADWILQEGEEVFRLREAAELEDLLRLAEDLRPKPVLACGGGTFCREPSRASLLAAAVCIWLDVPLAVALERASGGRPLLRGALAEIRALYEARLPLYGECHIRIPAAGRTPAEVAEEAAARLSRWKTAGAASPGEAPEEGR